MCVFNITVHDYKEEDFEDLDDFDDKIRMTMETSFEDQLQIRFPNFEKWRAKLKIDTLDFPPLKEAKGSVIKCEIVCKSYKGERSFKKYSRKTSPQSKELWRKLRESIVRSCEDKNGIVIEVSRVGNWEIGSIIINFLIKKSKGDWMYEHLENLRRAVKGGLYEVFGSYEISADILMSSLTARKPSEGNPYVCAMSFSTCKADMVNEIQHFLNEVKFEDLRYNGKDFIGGFSTGEHKIIHVLLFRDFYF